MFNLEGVYKIDDIRKLSDSARSYLYEQYKNEFHDIASRLNEIGHFLANDISVSTKELCDLDGVEASIDESLKKLAELIETLDPDSPILDKYLTWY